MSNEIEEIHSANALNKKANEGPSLAAEPVQTEIENEWRQSLLDLVNKEDYYRSYYLARFFSKHPSANLYTVLHILATAAGDQSKYAFYRDVINMMEKIEDLVVKDKNGNTLLSNAVRHGREVMVELLIKRNKELLDKQKTNNYKDYLLTTLPDAEGKIPVQLACERGNEELTKLLYMETPWHLLRPENGDYGFFLLKECICKTMFEIALHLLYQIPELAFHKCCSDITCILPTLAQCLESPVSSVKRLAFWNRWLYHCINFEVKFKRNNKPADGGRETGFDVYVHILGISWKNWSVLKPASIHEADQQELRVDPNQQELGVQDEEHNNNMLLDWADIQQEENEEASKKMLVDRGDPQQEQNEAANLLVDQADLQQQEHSVEANQQFVQGDQQEKFDIRKRNLLEREANPLLRLVSKLASLNIVILGSKLLSALGLMTLVLIGLGFLLFATLLFFATRILLLPVKIFNKLLGLIGLKRTHDLKLNHVYTKKILNLISEQLRELGPHEIAQNGATEATFLAIKNHIPEIVIEFTKANENVLWQCSDLEDPERNMLALTVIHRQEEVAGYLYGFETKNVINIIDEDGSNMLHLAAKLASPAQLAHISGAALQLQSELRWFKEVEGIVPWFQKGTKNKKGKTPFELFVSEHKELMKEAEDWMKKTAESSTVVGALIITIMFSAAFTVPGGNNQDTGLPIFSNKTSFLIFIIADAISLFAASTSVLMFLGILTSRYALEDFSKSLPMKLILGLSSLFISIAAMVAAFCAALFIMLQGRLQVVIPVTMLAGIPVTSFALLQFPLLVEILKSTYSPYIFKAEMENAFYKMMHLLLQSWKDFVNAFLCYFVSIN